MRGTFWLWPLSTTIIHHRRKRSNLVTPFQANMSRFKEKTRRFRMETHTSTTLRFVFMDRRRCVTASCARFVNKVNQRNQATALFFEGISDRLIAQLNVSCPRLATRSFVWYLLLKLGHCDICLVASSRSTDLSGFAKGALAVIRSPSRRYAFSLRCGCVFEERIQTVKWRSVNQKLEGSGIILEML